MELSFYVFNSNDSSDFELIETIWDCRLRMSGTEKLCAENSDATRGLGKLH
jgi:hypothetical protein